MCIFRIKYIRMQFEWWWRWPSGSDGWYRRPACQCFTRTFCINYCVKNTSKIYSRPNNCRIHVLFNNNNNTGGDIAYKQWSNHLWWWFTIIIYYYVCYIDWLFGYIIYYYILYYLYFQIYVYSFFAVLW